jgi:GAF domain-containing protein
MPSAALHPLSAPARHEQVAELQRQLDAVTRERDQLLVVVDLLKELAAAAQVRDVLLRVARRLGEVFGLNRCSIYLAGHGKDEVRLAATFEDPSLTNLVVDLTRYPELQEAFASGQTVFIPDAMSDPMLAGVRHTLDARKVSAIVVVPIRWRQSVIGAIFLRSERGAAPLTEQDVRFCEVIAGLTGRALRNAHQAEVRDAQNDAVAQRRGRADRERIAFVAFLRRLLQQYATSDDQLWAETLLPRESDDELDRLVSVALQVLAEEAKG